MHVCAVITGAVSSVEVPHEEALCVFMSAQYSTSRVLILAVGVSLLCDLSNRYGQYKSNVSIHTARLRQQGQHDYVDVLSV